MDVLFHPEAEAELGALPDAEKLAMDHAVEKLEVLGDRLPFPHTSAVKGADRLRELRPRAGRSPWRALYRRIGRVMVVGAVGPDAQVDRKRFEATIRKAEARLALIEEPRRSGRRGTKR